MHMLILNYPNPAQLRSSRSTLRCSRDTVPGFWLPSGAGALPSDHTCTIVCHLVAPQWIRSLPPPLILTYSPTLPSRSDHIYSPHHPEARFESPRATSPPTSPRSHFRGRHVRPRSPRLSRRQRRLWNPNYTRQRARLLAYVRCACRAHLRSSAPCWAVVELVQTSSLSLPHCCGRRGQQPPRYPRAAPRSPSFYFISMHCILDFTGQSAIRRRRERCQRYLDITYALTSMCIYARDNRMGGSRVTIPRRAPLYLLRMAVRIQ